MRRRLLRTPLAPGAEPHRWYTKHIARARRCAHSLLWCSARAQGRWQQCCTGLGAAAEMRLPGDGEATAVNGCPHHERIAGGYIEAMACRAGAEGGWAAGEPGLRPFFRA